jgi:hypothetical protein
VWTLGLRVVWARTSVMLRVRAGMSVPGGAMIFEILAVDEV